MALSSTAGLRRLLAVLRDAAPLMVAELLPSLASLVDMYFVRGYGDAAVAGVGVGGYAAWLYAVPLAAVYTGGLVAFSQAVGAGERGRLRRLVGETLSAALALAALLAAAAYASAAPLAGFLSGGGEASGEAVSYLYARLPGLPGFAALLVLDAALRALGRNREILWGAASAAATNMVLDALLAPVLGVTGVGAATAASNYAGAATLYLALRRAGLAASPAPPGREALLVLRVGAPAAVERGLFSLGHGLYLASLGRCGEPQLTAHTLGVRVESLAFLPAFALATYASSVVGNEVGAGRIVEAKTRGWEAAKASAAFMTLAGVALAAAAPLAAEALAPSRHVARLVVVYLLLAAATEPALGLVMSLAGALRGAGETRLPTLVNLAVLYGVRVAPSWLLAPRLGGDCCAIAAWLLMDLDVVVRAAVFTFIYLRMFERLARRVV